MARKTPEGRFKSMFQNELERAFPGCVLLKNDANAIQGIPDILFLYHGFWAMFEVKESATATHQPNQDWWVARLDQMSFAAFVYPENMEEVLDALQYTLQSSGEARVP